MNINLFLDIETTGLMPKGADWRTDYQDFPFILSIAFKPMDGPAQEAIIRNCDIEINEDITKINGIDKEKVDKEGIAFINFFPKIIHPLLYSEKIIGHNIYFDSSIIKSNVLRFFGEYSLEFEQIESALHKDKRIDTMRMAQKKFGGKYMSLEDLHFKLFNQTFEAHSALNDAIACERCYNEMSV